MPDVSAPPAFTWDWDHESLTYVPEVGDNKNVVTSIRYILVARSGGLEERITGTVTLGPPPYNPAEFVEIEELTADQVGGWVAEALGGSLAMLQNQLAGRLSARLNPPLTTRPPWVPAPSLAAPPVVQPQPVAPVGATT